MKKNKISIFLAAIFLAAIFFVKLDRVGNITHAYNAECAQYCTGDNADLNDCNSCEASYTAGESVTAPNCPADANTLAGCDACGGKWDSEIGTCGWNTGGVSEAETSCTNSGGTWDSEIGTCGWKTGGGSPASGGGSCLSNCVANGGNDTECASECAVGGAVDGSNVKTTGAMNIPGLGDVPAGSIINKITGQITSSTGQLLGTIVDPTTLNNILGSGNVNNPQQPVAGCPDATFKKVGGICMPINSGLSEATISGILGNFLNWVLGIFATLALLAFAISGIQYLVSAGDDTMIETAKNNMKWSLVGIIVGISGFIIVQAINAFLQGTSSTF